MICKSCGREIPEQAKFCKYCGARCEQAAAAQPETPEKPKPTHRRKLVAIVCAAAILVGVIAGVVIWKSGSQPEPTLQAPEEQTPEQSAYTARITASGGALRVGGSLELQAAVEQELPADVSVSGTVWTSADTKIATVADGVVYGMAEGSVEITAVITLSDGAQAEASYTVRVQAAQKTYTLEITPKSLSIPAGTSGELKAELKQELEQGVTITQTTWTSADSRIAAVSQGRVQGVGEGSALITASVTLSDGQTLQATAEVTVTAAVPVTGPTPNQGDISQQEEPEQQTQQPQEEQTQQPAPTPAPTPTPTPTPSPAPTGVDAVVTEEYVISNSATEYISLASLATLTDEQLLIARNEIYARHGRCFVDEFLRNYFSSQSWYNPTIQPNDFDPDCFNTYEVENLSRIQQVEASRK